MPNIESIKQKYGFQADARMVGNGKLNEAKLHKLLTKAGVAKKKIIEAEPAKKEWDSIVNELNQMMQALSFNEKQKAREIYKQYKQELVPHILGLN